MSHTHIVVWVEPWDGCNCNRIPQHSSFDLFWSIFKSPGLPPNSVINICFWTTKNTTKLEERCFPGTIFRLVSFHCGHHLWCGCKQHLHIYSTTVDEAKGSFYSTLHWLILQVFHMCMKRKMLIPVQVSVPVGPRRTLPRHIQSRRPRWSSSGSRTLASWPFSPSLQAWL